jgi:hypothetical protein
MKPFKTALLFGVCMAIFYLFSCQHLIDDFEVKPGSNPILLPVKSSTGADLLCEFYQSISVGEKYLIVKVKNNASDTISTATLLFTVFENNSYDPANMVIEQSCTFKNILPKQYASDTFLLADYLTKPIDAKLIRADLLSFTGNDNPFHGLFGGLAQLYNETDVESPYAFAPAKFAVFVEGRSRFAFSGASDIKLITGYIDTAGNFRGEALDGSGAFIASTQTDSLMPAQLLPDNSLKMDLFLIGGSTMELTKKIKIQCSKQ